MSIASILYQKGDEVATISPAATVKAAADELRQRNIAALVVTGADSILGVISEREIVHGFAQHGTRLESMTVKDIMRAEPVTVTRGDSLRRAMSLMTRARMRHLPVVREGKLAGIISIGDVIKQRLEDLELQTHTERDSLHLSWH
ncbi:MAG TPA: CBS domain-containing protein [Micropepsaceae bacterium]|jgi:CBS domain-containing protein|nr:CBS domain-containing protein [Micropepsaceae bacterium]